MRVRPAIIMLRMPRTAAGKKIILSGSVTVVSHPGLVALQRLMTGETMMSIRQAAAVTLQTNPIRWKTALAKTMIERMPCANKDMKLMHELPA